MEAPREVLDKCQRRRSQHALGSFDSGCRWNSHTRHIIQYCGGNIAVASLARL
jgi:hypothetical protein